MAYLRYRFDSGEEALTPIDAEHPIVKIGRSAECSIRTRNGTVSRRHCQVVFTGTSYKVYDLNSSNGTFYDRERIREHTLAPGDIFHCGNFQLQFVEDLPGDMGRGPVSGSAASPATAPMDLSGPGPSLVTEPAADVSRFREGIEGAVDRGAGAARALSAGDSVGRDVDFGRETVGVEPEAIGRETTGRGTIPPYPAQLPSDSADAARVVVLERELADARERSQMLELQVQQLSEALDDAVAGEEHAERSARALRDKVDDLERKSRELPAVRDSQLDGADGEALGLATSQLSAALSLLDRALNRARHAARDLGVRAQANARRERDGRHVQRASGWQMDVPDGAEPDAPGADAPAQAALSEAIQAAAAARSALDTLRGMADGQAPGGFEG